MRAAVFELFSGLHAGARIELTEGDWVIGSDDSCDLILADEGFAPRHASVSVKSGEVGIVTLDGKVTTLEGRSVANEVWPKGTVLLFGTVAVAWGAPDDSEDYWSDLRGRWRATLLPTAPAAELKADAASEAKVSPGEVPKDDEAAAAAKAEKTEEKSKGHGVLVGTALVLAVLLAGGWTLARDADLRRSVEADFAKTNPNAVTALYSSVFGVDGLLARFGWLSPEAVPEEELVAGLRAKLNEEGFANVTAQKAGTGVWHLTGRVANDEERGRLVKLARTLTVPAVLDVDVDTDRTAPWLAAFQARGFKTEVHLEGTSGTPVLTVLGYMRTKDVEDKAFAEVSYELSADSVDVKRRIVHESDVKPLLDRAIKEQGLEDVTVEWHPGRITLSAPLSPKTRNMLTAAMQQVGRTVHVPLSYELLHREARKTAAKAPARRSAPKDSMTPNFRVTGVSGGKLKFVTLSTGEKVFAGGRLPGGFTLESISHNRLTLSKSGKRINYPLKVSSK